MSVQMNWKNPKVELPEVDPCEDSPCLMISVGYTRYPIKVWYDGDGFYTPNGDLIFKESIEAWDYHPENFSGNWENDVGVVGIGLDEESPEPTETLKEVFKDNSDISIEI